MENEKLNPMLGENNSTRRIGKFWTTLVVLILTVCVVLLFFGIGSRQKALEARAKENIKTENPGVNVVTLDLSPGTIQDRINLPGIVKPWVRLEVVAEVSGKVIQKTLNQGDAVKKGDLIAVLDSRDYQNAYNSAHASYTSARASLDRMEKLHAEQLATRSQLDGAGAEVENFKAMMDTAALNLERCRIQAPIDGAINHLFIEEGEYLNVSKPVCEILQTNPVKVTVGIPESDVVAVRRLSRFDIRIDALDGKAFTGEMSFLSRTADPAARLYTLEIKTPNPEGLLLPDMFARVDIVKQVKADCIIAPLFAFISTGNGAALAFVEKDGVAHTRNVTLGIQEGMMVEIVSGLEPSDKLVVVGQRSIADGQKLRVVRSVRSIEELGQ